MLHNHRVSDGLHFIDQGSRGDKVDIELPEFGIEELKANSVSPLFLSVPDPMNEFKRFASFSKWIVKNADTSLTHLSKFIHLDQQSKTDDGRFASQGGMKTHGVNALDQLVYQILVHIVNIHHLHELTLDHSLQFLVPTDQMLD